MKSGSARLPEYTIEVCEAVMDVIEPTPDDPITLNLRTSSRCLGVA